MMMNAKIYTIHDSNSDSLYKNLLSKSTVLIDRCFQVNNKIDFQQSIKPFPRPQSNSNRLYGAMSTDHLSGLLGLQRKGNPPQSALSWISEKVISNFIFSS